MCGTTVLNAFFFLLVFAFTFSLSITKEDVIEKLRKKVADSQVRLERYCNNNNNYIYIYT